MAKEKHICEGHNKPVGMVGLLHYAHYRSYYKCDKIASMFEKNKWWCKRHAPSKIKEREEKAEKRDNERIWRNMERNKDIQVGDKYHKLRK